MFRYIQLSSNLFVRIAVRVHRYARLLHLFERVRHQDDFRVYGSKNLTRVLYAIGSPTVKLTLTQIIRYLYLWRRKKTAQDRVQSGFGPVRSSFTLPDSG
jgi:hypothetical protein